MIPKDSLKESPKDSSNNIPQGIPACESPIRAVPCRATSMSYGGHMVLPTVDENPYGRKRERATEIR